MENATKFLQEKELDMVKEFLKICEKHNLKYFMAGGTFLGAVRHKGFIPWDDDVDLGMYRDDYEKFLDIAKRELPYPYEVHTYRNCKEHHYYFSHIIDVRYKVRRMGSLDKREEYVWIDIFPYDGLPKGRLSLCSSMSDFFFIDFVIIWLTLIKLILQEMIEQNGKKRFFKY